MQKRKVEQAPNFSGIPIKFSGKIVIFGFGAIARGVFPLLFKHIDKPNIIIITNNDKTMELADEFHVSHFLDGLNKNNYQQVLAKYLTAGDLLLNLSVNVDSVALIEWCYRHQVLYVDTSIEAWGDVYSDPNLSVSQRSNYALRQRVLDARQQLQAKHKNSGQQHNPTAIFAHGANPGLVNHFVKKALLNIAADTGHYVNQQELKGNNRQQHWAQLAKDLNIKVIHIAERDTQYANSPKMRNEFVNTWSVDGFISEATQPAELGFGTHEKTIPPDGAKHDFGTGAAIYLNHAGADVMAYSWTPDDGSYLGFIIPHIESISLADYFTLWSAKAKPSPNLTPLYRPTVHYVYHPCDAAILSLYELRENNFKPAAQPNKRIIIKEIIGGADELGVLLMGHKNNGYWYGSRLQATTAQQLARENSATTLQVCVGALSAVLWAIENPNKGFLEADDLPFDEILAICNPYLGDLVGEYTDWNPLLMQTPLFPADIDRFDRTDPWQFKNFRFGKIN